MIIDIETGRYDYLGDWTYADPIGITASTSGVASGVIESFPTPSHGGAGLYSITIDENLYETGVTYYYIWEYNFKVGVPQEAWGTFTAGEDHTPPATPGGEVVTGAPTTPRGIDAE